MASWVCALSADSPAKLASSLKGIELSAAAGRRGLVGAGSFIEERVDGALVGSGCRSLSNHIRTDGLDASLRADGMLVDVRHSAEITSACAVTTRRNMGR